MTNAINFDSFFNKTIKDQNNNTVTDINAGLDNLFTYFNDVADSLYEVQNYLVSEYEEGYPDLVANNSALGSQEYWWWILLLNRLEDPLIDIKYNWVYSINSEQQINNFIESSNNNATNNEENTRIGSVIELN